MSHFIHLSSKAPWVIESCYIILLLWYALYSRKLARLSVCMSSSQSISTTHTLFFFQTVVTKHATVKLYYITDAFSNAGLRSLPPPTLFSSGMKVTGGQTLHGCITPSYLGQWCTVILASCHDVVLSNVKMDGKSDGRAQGVRKYIDGAVKKQESKLVLG